MKLKLDPDYCCGGGHCGPMPGYFFKCPECDMDSQCKTGYPLEINETLSCYFCKAKFLAKLKIDDFEFEFEMTEPGQQKETTK